jgi:16S rRNA (cytidine1402-2'-O)-methyltransferase
VGTLYLIDVPPGAPDDISHRALRTLSIAGSAVADDAAFARQLLAQHGVTLPIAQLATIDEPLIALETGDVALLLAGWAPGPADPSLDLIRAAVERGFSVVPVPGPALSITALILSGLPAGSFVHLGLLPPLPADRLPLLESVVAERRTAVALAPHESLSAVLSELGRLLDDRPLVIVTSSGQSPHILWRGTIAGLPEQGLAGITEGEPQAMVALVVGGTQRAPAAWDRERLVVEIRACLDQGLGTKETSRQLVKASGWSRRDIYELAVEVASA